jgi:rubrerythrin
MFLKDLQAQEQLCITKYQDYAQRANDPQLKQIFNEILTDEQTHSQTIQQMMDGIAPMPAKEQQKPQPPKPQVSNCDVQEQKDDALLCQDQLATEKYVASTYNTSVFEFRDTGMRDALNHIQKEEQEHGKRLYDYMAVNGMYQAN